MEAEDSEKRGRPGLIHHMSEREVDVGGGANIQICKRINSKSEFLTCKDE